MPSHSRGIRHQANQVDGYTGPIITCILVLCAWALLGCDGELRLEWISYKANFTKSYCDRSEDLVHFKVFSQNFERVKQHNLRKLNGEVSFSIGLNQYSDLSTQEINAILNGYIAQLEKNDINNLNPDTEEEIKQHLNALNVEYSELPKEVDWRNRGAVSPVKDQKQCGSCWAFSSTGALEGQHFIKTGNLISLSEQNLIDCSEKYGNMGCDGGAMNNAFRYIKDNRGLDTENSYPYEGHNENCRFRKTFVGASDRGYVNIPTGDEVKLMQAVALRGPISVAIDASHESFHLYKDGIYYERNCSNELDDLNHAVLVVGYGTDPEHGDYWLVKNSWSETWGQRGYIKMARNKDNQCGIATSASYPIVKVII